jgi:hypothetical protein
LEELAVDSYPRALYLDYVANLRDEAVLMRMDDDGAAGRV